MLENAVSDAGPAGERAAEGPALLGVWNRPTGAGGGMAAVDGPAASAAAEPWPWRCNRLITSCVSSLVRLLRCFSASSKFAVLGAPWVARGTSEAGCAAERVARGTSSASDSASSRRKTRDVDRRRLGLKSDGWGARDEANSARNRSFDAPRARRARWMVLRRKEPLRSRRLVIRGTHEPARGERRGERRNLLREISFLNADRAAGGVANAPSSSSRRYPTGEG